MYAEYWAEIVENANKHHQKLKKCVHNWPINMCVHIFKANVMKKEVRRNSWFMYTFVIGRIMDQDLTAYYDHQVIWFNSVLKWVGSTLWLVAHSGW